jgi:hypothetical protein
MADYGYRRGGDPDAVIRATWISRQAEAEAAWLAGGGGSERNETEQDPAARFRRISELAYRHAQRRGFRPGGELHDWLEAEREVDTMVWR